MRNSFQIICVWFSIKSNQYQHREAEAKIKDIQGSHQDDISHMESKLVSLQTSLDAVSDTEKLRSQSRENNELQLKVVDLLNELSEVREAKETIKVDYEHQERIHKRQLLDEKANGKQMCADRDGYKTRIGCLEAEIKDLASRNERLVEQSQEESKESINVRNRLEETVNGYAIETSDLKKAFLIEKAEMSNAVDDTKKKNHELKRFDLTKN
jgi:hypothetical protein